MKTVYSLLSLLLLTGCVCTTPPEHPHHHQWVPANPHALVNNSGYTLTVYRDGNCIGTLAVGEVLPITGPPLWQRTVITVTGQDNGRYVGTASWVYLYEAPEVWTVNRLLKPAP